MNGKAKTFLKNLSTCGPLPVALLTITLQLTSLDLLAGEITLKADPSNSVQVKRGKRVYDRFCSFCHGIDLKGQADWRKRNKEGRLPAPPHDETGHTWHHDDELLFGIIKEGLVPPYAPKGYESDMPGWKNTLKDSDIWAVLSYIKSRWPKKTLDVSNEINAEAIKAQ